MDQIPRIESALLIEQLMVKVDPEMAQEIRMLKARHRVNVPEIVRTYLKKELPKLKKMLESA